VQKNIATFGGDAGRVTLMGHGSGATNVLGLSISPLATLPAPQTDRGTHLTGSGRVKLFHGIVLLSASPRIDTALKDIEPDNEVFAITAGCTQDKLAMQVECLRKLDVDTVLRVTPPYKWDPQVNPRRDQNDLPVKGARNPGLVIVDGDVIPQPSWTALGKSSLLANVPVMAMVMAEESDALPANKVHSWEQLHRLVSQRLDSFGTFWKGGAAATRATSFTSEALKLYPESMYPHPQQAYETMITDVRLTCPTKKALGLMASATTNKVYMAVNHLRLVEPVAVVALSSDGIRSTSVDGLAEALVTDFSSKYSFHGLDMMLYMEDETRYKLTTQDKSTAASLQGLLDTFVRTGSTKTANRFSAPNPLSWSWRPVTDSPNFVTFDSLKYPTNLDVADISAAMGKTKVTMTYDFHTAQCELWARDDIDVSYASAA